VNLVLLLAVVLTALVRIGSVLENQATAERQKFPAAAVEWIQAHRPAPNLLNSYGWGGYLIWRLYPDYKVFIDGRADVHGDAFIEGFLEAYRAETGWQSKLAETGVRLVLVEPDAPLANALANDSLWTLAFSDSQSVIYQKK
jgi:hypothetical protein